MKNLKKSSLLTGTLVAGALFATTADATAKTSLDFNTLGTGSQLRARLMTDGFTSNLVNAENALKTIEGACGEKKADTKTEAKAKDAKCGEGKCGEGKCGDSKDKKTEKKAAKKTSKKAAKKTAEAKSTEASCGEKKASN
ncbi:hypothetical protein ACLI1A_06530 [Flavobacterium sp. RHBU_3]|uniref:hypothetical protein n=1 Tax=Flavobacterium sp. RHBU_3 TaxID=3391184 RepID=UPI00398527A4